MSATLTSTNESFTVSLDVPAADATEVRGSVAFRESRLQSARVELALFATWTPERAGHLGLAGEARLGAARAEIGRKSEPTPFTLPLPAVAGAYTGKAFSIRPGVVVGGAEGDALRVMFDVPATRDQAQLVVRGLPARIPLARPERFACGVQLVALGLVTLIVRPLGEGEPSYAAGGVALIAGVVLAALSFRGIYGLVVTGVRTVTIERAELTAPRGISISLPTRRIAGARARLVAAEFEQDEGHTEEHGVIAAREVDMVAGGGGLQAMLPLPDAEGVPPSLALRSGRTVVGVRWRLELECRTAGGRVARWALPLRVGIERSKVAST